MILVIEIKVIKLYVDEMFPIKNLYINFSK